MQERDFFYIKSETGIQDLNLPFNVEICQFPLQLSHVMTVIHKDKSSLRLGSTSPLQPLFIHGKLYAAFYRVRKLSDVAVKVLKSGTQGKYRGKMLTIKILYAKGF